MHRRVRDASRLVRVIVDIVDIVEERVTTKDRYAAKLRVRLRGPLLSNDSNAN